MCVRLFIFIYSGKVHILHSICEKLSNMTQPSVKVKLYPGRKIAENLFSWVGYENKIKKPLVSNWNVFDPFS